MSEEDSRDRVCIYCKNEGKIAIIKVKNFARHIKEQHNARY